MATLDPSPSHRRIGDSEGERTNTCSVAQTDVYASIFPAYEEGVIGAPVTGELPYTVPLTPIE